jgi:thiol-disulfide isomerase/thioredoxin
MVSSGWGTRRLVRVQSGAKPQATIPAMSARPFPVLLLLAATAAAQTEDPLRAVITTPGGDLPFVMTAIMGPYRICHGDHEQPVRWRQGVQAPPYFVDFPPYDSFLEYGEMENAQERHGAHRGKWTKIGPAGAVSMPFRWEYWPMVEDPTEPHRRLYGPLFALPGEPWDPCGRWSVQFAKDPHPAVAILEPSRSNWIKGPGEIQGTVLTTTGDHGALAGTARGGELRLAGFDGAHAFLLAARLQKDGSLVGDFWSGASWHETWVARRDEKAALPDALTLTKAREGASLRELAFPDAVTGDVLRLGDLCGEVTLVVLFGTWCPNCNDLGALVRELHAQFGGRGLRVVGLAFEHGAAVDRHRRVVAAYRQKHGAAWPVLLAGPSDKEAASAAFPVVDEVRAFPTTLFVDVEGKVRAVHQGFLGPAAGDAHAAERRSFTGLVQRLLDEAEAARARR